MSTAPRSLPTSSCCGGGAPALDPSRAGTLEADASADRVREVVRRGYAAVAREGASVCCGGASADEHAKRLGYGDDELEAVPEGANLGLGCGNPGAIAALAPGEVVVDLGSGAGFDALLAAPRVGPEGRVIGIDMTPEMLERARKNAIAAGFARTVEFREGTIEAMPVVSGTADCVISNCVVNLSPDKPAAFREAFRVLKPGGRLAVSDIVLSEPLPAEVARLAASVVACVGGAVTEAEYMAAIRDAGFVDVRWSRRPAAELLFGGADDPLVQAAIAAVGIERASAVAETLFGYAIEARKPAAAVSETRP